jgi:two-component system capsular synthesis response regulator RcsB
VSIKVAVIDDHDVIHLGIRQYLSDRSLGEFVAGFVDVQSFCHDPRARHIDVLVLDDTLTIHVVDAVRLIATQHPHLAIIVLGCKLNAQSMHTLSDLGVLGFICKYDALNETLGTAVRRVSRGQAYLSPEAALVQRETALPKALSPRLLRVLRWIAQGMTTQDISRELGVSDRTVYSARARLHDIFNVQTDAELITKAFRYGLLDHTSRHCPM